MKTFNRFTFKKILVLGLLLISSSTFAEDFSVPQFTACKVVSGKGDQSQFRFKVNSTSAVMTCGIPKKAGTNSIQSVRVRLVRPYSNLPPPYCTLSSQMEFYTSHSTSVRWGSSRVSVQELSLPIPTQYNTGYLTVTCSLYLGDELYGIHYRHID